MLARHRRRKATDMVHDQRAGQGPQLLFALAELFARRLAGDNGPARVVPYAAEAGQFQEAGFSTVICGPGSIDQAHQPDEYVERTQMERGGAFMARLIDWAAKGE